MDALIFWAVLVSLGYFFGHRAEKKHYRSIIRREQAWLQVPATSSRQPLGNPAPVVRSELVTGSMVVSVDYFKRMLAALRNLFGGPVQSYETLLDRARREAVLRLKESCPGADQIINLRLETSSISKNANNGVGAVEVLAYGTALYFERRV